jgi:hypothetical protein
MPTPKYPVVVCGSLIGALGYAACHDHNECHLPEGAGPLSLPLSIAAGTSTFYVAGSNTATSQVFILNVPQTPAGDMAVQSLSAEHHTETVWQVHHGFQGEA